MKESAAMVRARSESIDEHIRRMVADAIATSHLLDVEYSAELIARAHGCPSFILPITADLAEAALAARVPMKLPASVRLWQGPDVLRSDVERPSNAMSFAGLIDA
jgi:hypothetical protein